MHSHRITGAICVVSKQGNNCAAHGGAYAMLGKFGEQSPGFLPELEGPTRLKSGGLEGGWASVRPNSFGGPWGAESRESSDYGSLPY